MEPSAMQDESGAVIFWVIFLLVTTAFLLASRWASKLAKEHDAVRGARRALKRYKREKPLGADDPLLAEARVLIKEVRHIKARMNRLSEELSMSATKETRALILAEQESLVNTLQGWQEKFSRTIEAHPSF